MRIDSGRTFVFVAVLACAALPARAQDSLRIGLSDAVRAALAQAPSVQRAANAVRAAEERVSLAGSTFGPDLRLQANPNVRYAPGAGGGAGGETTGGSGDEAVAGMSLAAVSTLSLLDGSGRRAALDAAGHELDAARLTADRVTQEVALSVTSAFVDAMITRGLIALERENLEAESRQAERVEAFVAAGTRPVSERFTQQAAVASAELRVLTAERNHQVALLRLCLAMGREPTTEIALIAPSIPEPRAIAETPDPAGRPDLRAAGARVAAAERGVDEAASGDALGLGLTGSVGTSYSSAGSASVGDQFGRDNPSASVGVSITLPLVDRGRVAAETALAETQRDERARELASLRREALAEEREAVLNYTTAVKRVAVAGRQVEAARQALDAEEARYQSGSSTLAELALARARYLAAATQRLQADYELLETDTALAVARGAISIPE